MYKIITKDNVPLPESNIIPLELVVHPELNGESLKFCAFIIREARHNHRGIFEKIKFQKLCGVKRRQTENAISQLIDLKVLSIYTLDGETIYELDYTTLLGLLSPNHISVVKRGQGILRKFIQEQESM